MAPGLSGSSGSLPGRRSKLVGGTEAIVTMSAWDYLPVSAKDSLAAGTGRSLVSCNHLLPACFSQSLCSLVSLRLMLYNLIGQDGSSGRDSSSTDIAGNDVYRKRSGKAKQMPVPSLSMYIPICLLYVRPFCCSEQPHNLHIFSAWQQQQQLAVKI